MNFWVHFDAFWSGFMAHWQAYGALSAAIFIAAIHVWPQDIPKTAQDWWTWARDTFQTAIPAARPTQPPPGEKDK